MIDTPLWRQVEDILYDLEHIREAIVRLRKQPSGNYNGVISRLKQEERSIKQELDALNRG